MSDDTLRLPGLPEPIRDKHGVPLFGSDQVRELQRQTVEVCAKVCADLMPQNERSDWTEYAQTKARALTFAMDAIRSLLKDQS